MKATNTDPDIPIFADNTQILTIDRLQSPYHPHNPHYLQQGLSWAEMEVLLQDLGL